MTVNPNGVIEHTTDRKADYLYRISLKALIRNNNGQVLVVREKGTTWWDLPGGGMDHNESVKEALQRELHEEVGFEGDFTYAVIDVDEQADFVEPANAWQVRLIFEVKPDNMNFTPGDDGEEVTFIDPAELEHSERDAERRIYQYCKIPLR